jgi:hypothetical protein
MKRILLIALITLFGLSFKAMAQGNLLITPVRIVFDGSKQTEELNLLNMGNDTATYSISFVQKNMKEDGSFVLIQEAEPGQMFADSYLRIFPRRVTLAPRAPQVIMLQYRRKADMVAGEYRSHLYFRSEQNYKPIGMKKLAKDSSQLLSVQITPIFGMSIPVIIRIGAVTVSTTLSDLKLAILSDTQTLNFTINRTGNSSTYGDIKIEYFPTHGKSYQVAIVAGVGVYSNISKRNMIVKLKTTSGSILNEGKLKVSYTSSERAKKPMLYAEQELVIK